MQKGRLSEDEARFYAAEVVDALEYIHNMGLIHRDIKVFSSMYVPLHQLLRNAKCLLHGSQRICYLLQMGILRLLTLAV